MEPLIHLLHLEDDPADAALIRHSRTSPHWWRSCVRATRTGS
jgi:hypothetical protein